MMPRYNSMAPLPQHHHISFGRTRTGPGSWGSAMIDSFEFTPSTPLAWWPVPLLTCIAYLAMVAAIKAHVKARGKPYDLKNVRAKGSAGTEGRGTEQASPCECVASFSRSQIVAESDRSLFPCFALCCWHCSFAFPSQVVTVYNFIMSGASGVLFVALAMELWASYRRAGFLDVFCDPWIRNTRGAMIFFYYINYIFKYIELVDTAFLCLRAKQTPFIHVVSKDRKP